MTEAASFLIQGHLCLFASPVAGMDTVAKRGGWKGWWAASHDDRCAVRWSVRRLTPPNSCNYASLLRLQNCPNGLRLPAIILASIRIGNGLPDGLAPSRLVGSSLIVRREGLPCNCARVVPFFITDSPPTPTLLTHDAGIPCVYIGST